MDIDRDRIERDIESVCIKGLSMSKVSRVTNNPYNALRLRNG